MKTLIGTSEGFLSLVPEFIRGVAYGKDVGYVRLISTLQREFASLFNPALGL